ATAIGHRPDGGITTVEHAQRQPAHLRQNAVGCPRLDKRPNLDVPQVRARNLMRRQASTPLRGAGQRLGQRGGDRRAREHHGFGMEGKVHSGRRLQAGVACGCLTTGFTFAGRGG
ncbi:hypothetical protein RZS08_49185, partial [Arthrospira platensis SPKY1]|nr:hypothetical protein [Arthrospira platensis SPKY1]